MKHLYLKSIFIFTALFLFSIGISAQNNKSIWAKTTQQKASQGKKMVRKSEPKKAVYYQLDLNMLKDILKNTSKRGESSKRSSIMIDFPDSEGGFETYRVKEASVFTSELQAKHLNMRSYIGQNIKNPYSLIRFSVTPKGLHTMVLSSKKGVQYIDPFTSDGLNYIVYSKKDLPILDKSFICNFIDDDQNSNRLVSNPKLISNANDEMLRTFDLALACTAEYGNFHGGTEASIKAAMMVTMTRVNGIFERDLSLTMKMVDNTSIIYFGDVSSDPYTNDDSGALLDENQTEIDSKIGSANYDIGHVFSKPNSGDGVVNGLVCQTGTKARGVTGVAVPSGDAFDIDFVAHEMGHQFGADHTWSSNNGSCSMSQWSSSNSYEPGSGTTIMAYAGICSPENVQLNSDAYFHQTSLQQIWTNITTETSTCAVKTSTGNTVPTAEAGPNYTIPISTPYKLTGSSTETNGDPISTHTYTWEQWDLAPSHGQEPDESNVDGPLVRSFEGTNNPIRYVPRLEDLVAFGGSTTWEKLSSLNNRNINFQLTVRDNDMDGGQTATDNMTVTVVDSNGPFKVTSQNASNISYTIGSTQTVTWDIADTNMNPINATLVNIKLSTDGGLTYPTLLESGTANDGSESVKLPAGVSAPYCRIMVEADPLQNIFFAINTTNFAIGFNVTNTCTQYTSGNLNITIPDATVDGEQGVVVGDITNIPSNGTITSVKVNVDVTHPYVSDLVIQVSHPNGSTSSVLWSQDCDNENGLDIIFEDGASIISCSNNQNPITGTFIPATPLNVLNGLNLNGNWSIAIADFFTGDEGVFNDWYLDICADIATPLSTDTFDFESLKIFPNPNKGEFTVKLNSTTNNDIKINIYDIRGRMIYNHKYRNTGNFNQNIKLDNVQSGIYLVKINDGERSTTKKIIVN